MFAYCNNNPVNRVDTHGTSGVAAIKNGYDFLAPFAAIIPALDAATPFVEIFCLVAVGAALWNEISTTSETEEKVIAEAGTVSGEESTVFYGADIVVDASGVKEWRIQTGPMDFDMALAWVDATAISGKYGKNASWGLYTEKGTDAEQMAIALGGNGPCLHEKRVGEYPHFHAAGMLLFGQYKHFHLWYGTVYTEG